VEKDMKIGTLMEGIKLSLETKLEKISEVDGLNHKYEKTTKFNTLPPYLFVQMVRFFWKVASDMPHSKPTAAKICKSIDFGHRLDLFDYCTEDLKTKLQPGREAIE
jgi:ubiquitin carboxyl-terminal hydrolase 14